MNSAPVLAVVIASEAISPAAQPRLRERAGREQRLGGSALDAGEGRPAARPRPRASPTRSGSPGPACSARVRPSTSSARPAVALTAPAMSSRRRARWPGSAGSRRSPSAIAAAHGATLTRKTHGQPSPSAIAPPATQPSAPPPAAAAVQAPSARLRARPSGVPSVSSASAAGETAAAPSPWIDARADQRGGARSEPARQRGAAEQREARDQHAGGGRAGPPRGPSASGSRRTPGCRR